MPLVQTLLASAIDYAGLFPPAQLDLVPAVNNYLAYQRSADAWALRRFVVPAARLAELEDLLRAGPLAAVPVADNRRALSTATWLPVAAVLSPGAAADVDTVGRFNRGAAQHGARVEAVEVLAASEAAVRAVLAEIPEGWPRYVELPFAGNGDALLNAVAAGHAFAKVRTGGMTADAFPSPDLLMEFLQGAARRRLPFKATAGLHHPVRGSYRLSYAEAAPSGSMYGFLNLILAAAMLWTGASPTDARAALLEEDPGSIRFEGSFLVWRAHRFSAAQLATMRASFFHAFGSCSFREPLDELAAGGWL